MEKKKLKISFLMPTRGTTGGVRSTVRFANGLLSHGHQVRIFYREDLPGLQSKIRKIYLKLRYSADKDWLLIFKGSSFRYSKLNANDFSSNELIISMCTQTTLDMWNLPEEISIKILHCRGVELHRWEEMLETWRLPIYRLAVSSRLAEMVEKETNQPVAGIIPNGVDTKEYFSSIPDSEREGIGSVFEWSSEKDPESVIKIMQMLGLRLPCVSRHVFSRGKKPKGLDSVNFKRLPTLEEAREIYSSCKVWFLASASEGCPNPLMEAMACGCAVVSTDCGGPSDIIKDGVNGFLVEVSDTKTMVNKIVLLYEDEQLRKKICTSAARTVKKYSWTNSIDKLERYLISIYNDKWHNNCGS